MIARAQNTPLDKVRVLQRKLYLAAKTNPKRKFGVLYDKVCREDVLRAAYAQVRANRGAPGIDQLSFEIIEKEVEVGTFLSDLRAQLVAKRYKPLPVRRVYIPKADGTQRPLGILGCETDRDVAQSWRDGRDVCPDGNDWHAAGWGYFALACKSLSALAGSDLGKERLRQPCSRCTHREICR